jgi:hypothetical protein
MIAGALARAACGRIRQGEGAAMSTNDSPRALRRGLSFSGILLLLLLEPFPFAAANPTFMADNVAPVWGTYYGDDATRTVAALAPVTDGVVVTLGRFGSEEQGLEAIVSFDAAGALQWRAFYGGASGDGSARALASVPSLGRVYVAGYTSYDAGIATPGAFQSARQCADSGACGYDAFVAQFDASGALRWGSYFGGPLNDYIHDASADPDGDVYVCGETESPTGIATAGAHQTRQGKGFLAKFGLGGELKWATYYDGRCSIVAADPTGNGVVISGWAAEGGDFATEGALQPELDGPNNAYLARFNAVGQRQWGSYFGEGHASIHDLEVDGTGAIYIVGATNEHDALVTAGVEQERYGGGESDLYISRLRANGEREWGTYFGGASYERLARAALDEAGNLYFSATTSSEELATIGEASATIAEQPDVIVGKFSRAGVLDWAFYQGGERGEQLGALAVGTDQRLYIGGTTQSDAGIATAGALRATLGGQQSAYVTMYRASW